MGFNKRKMEDARRQQAEKEAAARRATERQILEDAEQLVTAWNERQAKRMPMLFSPTIGAAITAGYWFLRARCPACRTTGDVDLRTLDWHRGAAVRLCRASGLAWLSFRREMPAHHLMLKNMNYTAHYPPVRRGHTLSTILMPHFQNFEFVSQWLPLNFLVTNCTALRGSFPALALGMPNDQHP